MGSGSLAALGVAVPALGSLVLGLALAAFRLDAAAAFALASLALFSIMLLAPFYLSNVAHLPAPELRRRNPASEARRPKHPFLPGLPEIAMDHWPLRSLSDGAAIGTVDRRRR